MNNITSHGPAIEKAFLKNLVLDISLCAEIKNDTYGGLASNIVSKIKFSYRIIMHSSYCIQI
jgi:hypothetical protein